MLSIRIVAVGGLREGYLRDAVAEYQKRLTKYCKLEIIEIKEGAPVPLKGHCMLCDIGGEMVTSEGLASKIEKLSMTGNMITFVIGGSDGIDVDVKDRISFGRITLPHQLFRVVLVEQIYRAFTISKGEKYHK